MSNVKERKGFDIIHRGKKGRKLCIMSYIYIIDSNMGFEKEFRKKFTMNEIFFLFLLILF